MNERLAALNASAARLRSLGEGLSEDALSASAYPTEWSVGDVFSHLGSAATILTHLFDDVVHQREAVPDVHTRVWSEWNAKHPSAQVAESLEADATLLERFDDLDEAGRDAFHLSLGPLELDFAGVVGVRLNEHAVHTWDIEVAFTPSAVIPAAIAGPILGNLRMVTRFAAQPDGEPRSVHVRTSNPVHDLAIEIGAEACDVGVAQGPVDLELPAEALVRLVYGRLDPKHAPVGVSGEVLEGLRRVFRGV
jgi:uncharacterized protein (TIGR03083 family)